MAWSAWALDPDNTEKGGGPGDRNGEGVGRERRGGVIAARLRVWPPRGCQSLWLSGSPSVSTPYSGPKALSPLPESERLKGCVPDARWRRRSGRKKSGGGERTLAAGQGGELAAPPPPT